MRKPKEDLQKEIILLREQVREDGDVAILREQIKALYRAYGEYIYYYCPKRYSTQDISEKQTIYYSRH